MHSGSTYSSNQCCLQELLQLQALRLDGSTLWGESCAHDNQQQQDAPLAVLAQARSGLSATLTVLAVSHCGLTSLQGVQLLVQLRELYAASNELTDLGPLQGRLPACAAPLVGCFCIQQL